MQTINTLIRRVEGLERQNRRLRTAVALTGAASLFALVTAAPSDGRAAGTAERIEAQRFVLTDAEGATRAILGELRGSIGLGLMDAEGNPIAVLGVAGDGSTTGLQLKDSGGANATLSPHGLDLGQGAKRTIYAIDGQR
jgi:hypothetical protein